MGLMGWEHHPASASMNLAAPAERESRTGRIRSQYECLSTTILALERLCDEVDGKDAPTMLKGPEPAVPRPLPVAVLLADLPELLQAFDFRLSECLGRLRGSLL